MSIVTSLVYQAQKSNRKQEPYRFNRTPAERLTLQAGYGIVGDKKAGKNPRRQLNLMSAETLNTLQQLDFDTAPGAMGEQIVLQGVDLAVLGEGMRLQIGESAVVELSLPRTGCKWMQQIHGRELPQGMNLPLGWMATVVETGDIAIGDAVKLLPENVAAETV